MERKREYTEHYVAFIDILGFKDLLDNKESCDAIFSVFQCLMDNSQTKMFYNGEDISAFDHVKHYIMSDSIVLYIRADIEEAFFALVGTCLYLQKSLLYRQKPVLVRGGIAKGPLFVEEQIIFGKGLSDAYIIESTSAIYPRIVFNKRLYEDAKKNNQSPKRTYWEALTIREDSDELCFVHYLALNYVHALNEIPALFENVFEFCQQHLDSTYNKSVREKYLWLKKYIQNETDLQKQLIKNYPGGKELIGKWVINDRMKRNNK